MSVAVINIGGTSNDRGQRSISSKILDNYDKWIFDKAEIARTFGYKSVMLMNPGGYDWGYKDFDEIIEARSNGFTSFIPDRYPYMISVLREMFDEVIVYLGSLYNDPNFIGLSINEYLTRIKQSLLPFRGARIAIDAMSHFPDYEILFHGELTTVLTCINKFFGPVILEGKYNERWTPENIIKYTNMWQYEIPPRDGDIAKPGSYVLIRSINNTIDVKQATQEVIAQGNIPCVGV